MADALLIAHLGGTERFAAAQKQYMRRHPSPYMRLIKAIQGSDLLSE